MTKAELLLRLEALPQDAQIFIEVRPWDEDLGLTGLAEVKLVCDFDEVPFAVIRPSTDGATRLDPAAV